MTDPDHVRIEDALIAVELLGARVRDVGLLASALERPRTDVFGVEAYPDLDTKAAALIDAINRAHPLDDGNKRLSWLLTALFYERNGYDLITDPDAGETFVLRIAGEHMELDDIAAWLREHRRARD